MSRFLKKSYIDFWIFVALKSNQNHNLAIESIEKVLNCFGNFVNGFKLFAVNFIKFKCKHFKFIFKVGLMYAAGTNSLYFFQNELFIVLLCLNVLVLVSILDEIFIVTCPHLFNSRTRRQ